jgi:surface antigen
MKIQRALNRLPKTLAVLAANGGPLVLLLALAGCASTTAPQMSSPAAPAPADERVPEPPAPGVIGVSVGQTLDGKDRTVAIAAQQDAIVSGARKSWRSASGAYGFILPGAETGACRPYTHKIFINGRPQEASGAACLKDGVWRAN